MVLLHGLFGDSANLRGLALTLEATKARTVLRLDLPGHGGRPAGPDLSLARQAAAIRTDVADALPAGTELHLVGHSLGGKVAMTLALAGDAFAQRLRSLTVLDIAPVRYAPHHRAILTALDALDLTALGSRRDADAALATGIPDPGVRAFLLKSLVRANDDAGRQSGFAWRFDLDAITRDYASELLAAPPGAGKAPADLPCLFVRGTASDYIDAAGREAVAARFPQARIESVDGAGHWLHAERPREVATLIDDTLQRADELAVTS